MAVILDTVTEWFSNSESPFHPDASHQVLAQYDVWRISRWSPWRPSWISEWKDYSNFEFLCHCDASHQVSAQSDLGFRRRCRLKNFKMAATLDIGTEQFQQFWISVSLWCLPSSFSSIWLRVWEEMSFEEFQDGHRGSHLCHCVASHQVSAQSDLAFGRRCRLKNFKMATVAAICVTVMPPIKFQLNRT